jgi:hypothetical protein
MSPNSNRGPSRRTPELAGVHQSERLGGTSVCEDERVDRCPSALAQTERAELE